jgi:hypothetical protein
MYMHITVDAACNSAQSKPHVFVLDFNGDVTASQVIAVGVICIKQT